TNTSTPRRQFIKSAAATSAAVLSGNALAAEEAWTTLFDGKDLTGWHKNPNKIGHGTGGSWKVEDGTITGEQDPPGSGNGGILLTDKKYGDFELTLEIKPDWGVCSGLFLRGSDKGECIQVMIDYHNDGNVGHLYGEGTFGWNTRGFDIHEKLDADGKMVGLRTNKHKTAKEAGLIHSCTPEAYVKTYKVDDWNTVRVLCVGSDPHITTWINGLKVCEFDGATSSNEVYAKNKEEIRNRLGTEGS
ncbi:MAG: family 16 glycoside hydrolase, partial [Verrucomicrobiales bacterium]